MNPMQNIDITAPENVEIVIRRDSKVIWINVDGGCVLRCSQINKLYLTDDRVLTRNAFQTGDNQ